MKSCQRLPAPFAKAGLLVVAVVLPMLAGCGYSEPDEARNAARAAVQSELQDAPALLFAGVSADPNRKVIPLDSATLPGPINSHQLHMFRHRCGACHKVPDPRMKYAYEWDGVVAGMQNKAANAGLLAFAQAEQESVRAFLRDHARRKSASK